MSDSWDIPKALSFKSTESIDEFSTENPIVYALSIGLSRDPKLEEDLKYTYENHEDYTIFPTYGSVVPKNAGILEQFLSVPGIPNFNPMQLLHGEQRVEVYKPLEAGIKYSTVGEVADIQDKVKGMLLTVDLITKECESKEIVYKQTMSLFVRKMGGFGFKGTGRKFIPFPDIPKREHDEQWEEKTEKNQAILYRLTGDKNPLHIDPSMAAMGGFDTPILHGMNFYGIAAKAVIKKFCDGDHKRFFALQARFTGHVFPGESILYKMWREPNNIIVISGYTVERNTNCIKGFAQIKPAASL